MSDFITFTSLDNINFSIHKSNPIFEKGIFRGLKGGFLPLPAENLQCLFYNYFPKNATLNWILEHLEKIDQFSLEYHNKICWTRIFEMGRDNKKLYDSKEYSNIKTRMFDHFTLHDLAYLRCGESTQKEIINGVFTYFEFDYIFSDFISYHLENLTIEEYDDYILHGNESGEMINSKDYIPSSLRLFKCDNITSICDGYSIISRNTVLFEQVVYLRETCSYSEIIRFIGDYYQDSKKMEKYRKNQSEKILLIYSKLQKSMVVELMRVCNNKVAAHAFKKYDLSFNEYQRLVMKIDIPKSPTWYREFSKEYCISQIRLCDEIKEYCKEYYKEHCKYYLFALSKLSDSSVLKDIEPLKIGKIIKLSDIVKEIHKGSNWICAPNLITFSDFIDTNFKKYGYAGNIYDINNNKILYDIDYKNVIIDCSNMQKYKDAIEYYKTSGLLNFFVKVGIKYIPFNEWAWK